MRIEIDVACDMVIPDGNIRIPALELCQLRAGQHVHRDPAAHLRLVGIVAVLIDASHQVKPVVQCQRIIDVVKCPIDADQSYAASRLQG